MYRPVRSERRRESDKRGEHDQTKHAWLRTFSPHLVPFAIHHSHYVHFACTGSQRLDLVRPSSSAGVRIEHSGRTGVAAASRGLYVHYGVVFPRFTSTLRSLLPITSHIIAHSLSRPSPCARQRAASRASAAFRAPGVTFVEPGLPPCPVSIG